MRILALRAVSLLLSVRSGSTFRVVKFKQAQRAKSEANESQEHLAWVSELSAQFEKAHAASSKNTIILFKEGKTNRDISDFCTKEVDRIPASTGCLSRGSPSNGGFGFVVVDTWVSKALSKNDKVDSDGFSTLSSYGVDGVDPDTPWIYHDSWSGGGGPQEASSTLEVNKGNHLDRTGARIAQQRYKGRGVHIYVMDSGVRTSHHDFNGRAFGALHNLGGDPWEMIECNEWDKWDTQCNTDTNGHGTLVAGVAAGSLHGVAPEATIWAMKPGPELFHLYMHMDWLGRNRKLPAVLSVSIGMRDSKVTGAENAINALVKGGVVIVVAAGNRGVDCSDISFAAHTQAIAVGSVNKWNARSGRKGKKRGAIWGSNWGRKVAIFAPGEDIASANASHDFATSEMSGTSMATPQVAGAVALILEANPSLSVSPELVEDHLLGMSDHAAVRYGRSKFNNLLDLRPLVDVAEQPVEDQDDDYQWWNTFLK